MDTPTSPTDSRETASTLLFCRVCQAVYKQPKLLPCLHSFCRACLVGSVTYDSDGPFINCPLCSHTARLPSSGVVGVPDNCFLSRMCQDYLMEVQNHLVARSRYPADQADSSEVAVSNSRLSKELSPSTYTPLPNPRYKGQDDIQTAKGEPQSLHIDHGSGTGQSTTTAVEAIRNMSRLQNKIMSLQGEALRVTYAIDQVNQSAADWHQHKEDLKMAVQRRSEQFQFHIKRMEHQLKAQIDSKQADDIFYADSHQSKTELRKNLNQILHQVTVLKSLQELGNDDEINALSANLMGKSVGLSNVALKKLHFDMSTSPKTIEEIVTGVFGEVNLDSEESNVYSPEIVDFTEISGRNVTEPLIGEKYPSLGRTKQISIDEDRELDNASIASSKRRSVDKRSRRYNTDLGLNKEDVKEYLAQFQNARESFRTRRKEILARGQMAREDTSPLRGETQRRHRSPSREGRVQSLDRVALPVTIRGRHALPINSNVQELANATPSQRDITPNLPEKNPAYHRDNKFQYGPVSSKFTPRFITQDANIPSPVPEDVLSPTSPQRKLVKQTSDPPYAQDVQPYPEDESNIETSHSNHSQSQIEQLRNRRFSNPSSGILTGRRHSDQFTSLLPGEQIPLDMLKQDASISRPVRRAITNAADRKTKIEFLRENWQKRKEILIQNDGFVSTDSAAKNTDRPHAQIQPPALSDIKATEPVETRSSLSSIAISSDDPRQENMEQIRNRIAKYRNDLTKTDENEVKTHESSFPSKTSFGEEQKTITTSRDLVIPEIATSQKRYDTITSKDTTAATPTSENIPYGTTEKSISDKAKLSGSVTLTTLVDQEEKAAKSPTTTAAQYQTDTSPKYSSTRPWLYRKERDTNSKATTTSLYQTETSAKSPTTTVTSQYQPGISAKAVTSPISNSQTDTSARYSTSSTSRYQTETSARSPSTTHSLNPTAPATNAPSPDQTVASASTSTYRSRYAQYLAKKTETVDVASLIAAMYSGNEKSILQSTTTSSATSNQPSLTTQATNSTTTTTTSSSRAMPISSAASSIRATDSSRITDTSSYADSNIASDNIRSTNSFRRTDRDVDGIKATDSNRVTDISRSAYTSRAVENARVTDTAADHLRAADKISGNFISTQVVSSSSAELISGASAADSSNHQTENSTDLTHHEQDVGIDKHSESYLPNQQSSESNVNSTELAQQSQPRNRRAMRSRFTDGVNRRHTIEVGKAEIQSALQMISRGEISAAHQTALHPISESPTINHTPTYTPYRSRYSDISSNNLESSNGDVTPLSSTAVSLETDDSNAAFRVRPIKSIPSPLHVIEERPLTTESTSPEATAVTPTSSLSPRSPSALSPTAIDQKLRLREIARKKKERWRHLTIH